MIQDGPCRSPNSGTRVASFLHSLLTVLFVFMVAAQSSANTPLPTWSTLGSCDQPAGAGLFTKYTNGDWDSLQSDARAAIQSCTFAKADKGFSLNEKDAIDLKRDYVVLVLIGTGVKGDYEEADVLVHDPAPSPYSLTFPGIGKEGPAHAFELFIHPDDGYSYTASYAVERVADPAAAKAADFLKKAFDLTSIGIVMAGKAEERRRYPATLTSLELPFRRATVTAVHVACGAHDLPCAAPWAPLQVYKRGAFVTFDGASYKCILANTAETGKDPASDSTHWVSAAAPKPFSSTAKYQNTPLRSWTFGLLTGLIATSHTTDRAKVASNVLSSDPMPATLTMAIVNIHPVPYDEAAPKMTGGERFRLFAGTVLTPSFGAGAGLGVGIVRGFGINLGGAVMATKRLKGGDEFGKVPKDSNSPTRLGVATAFFVGFSYAFQ